MANQYGILWKRPTEVAGGPVSLWGSEGINPKISQQGELGDCWFLSTASSLAAYPARIKEIFRGIEEYPKDGVFQLKLYVKGEPVNVIIDDVYPVLNLTKAQGYTYNYPPVNNGPSKAGAWWLVILEKAMAKLNNNYTGLNAGHIGQAMRYLTGMPTVEYQSSNMSTDQLWEHVTDGFEKDYNMGAPCLVSRYNMVAGHAYGVIGAHQLKGGAHDGQKLIKMRNPWGSN